MAAPITISNPLQSTRQYSGPLDVDMVFTLTAQRMAYLTSPRRYGGQIVSDLQTGGAYILSADKTSWSVLGGGTGSSVSNSDELVEGTVNLYFTEARARTAISLLNGLTYNSTTGIGQLGGALTVNTSITGGGIKSFDVSAIDALTFGAKSSTTIISNGTWFRKVLIDSTGISLDVKATVDGLYKGLQVKDDSDLKFDNYSDTRNDGPTIKALYVDNCGNVKYGPIKYPTGIISNFSSGDLSPIFTTQVVNATTTPTLSFLLSNAGANTYFGNATGSSAHPSYVTAGALTRTNDSNVTLTLGGSPATSLLQNVNLTLGWVGVLPIVRGGTGLSVVGTPLQVLRVKSDGTGLEYATINTDPPVITLTGDVTGSGTTTINTTITPNSVTYDKIQLVNPQRLLGRYSLTIGIVQEISLGVGLVLNSTTGVLSATSTLTSFSAGNLSPLFTTTVSNSTTTPNLSFTLSQAAANTYFGNNTGASAQPSFIAAGALTKVDDTNVTLTLGGNPATSLLRSVSLTLGWTGILGISRGGTGMGTLGTSLQVIRVKADGSGLEYWTPTYISGNQTITLTGDVTGSGTTNIATTVVWVNGYPTYDARYTPLTRTLTINGVAQTLAADRTWNVGTVTSVNATISGALAVSGGPITVSGTLAFAWQGTSGQYVKGDGSLGTISHGVSNAIGTQQFTFGQGENIRFEGTGATVVSFDPSTKKITFNSPVVSATVTSVSATISGALAVSGSPITTSGTLAFTWQGTTLQYVRGDGSLATFPTIPSGTVTSVGATISGALAVSGSPVTTSGTLAFTWQGNTSQYVRGDGSLAVFPTIPNSGNYIVNNFATGTQQTSASYKIDGSGEVGGNMTIGALGVINGLGLIVQNIGITTTVSQIGRGGAAGSEFGVVTLFNLANSSKGVSLSAFDGSALLNLIRITNATTAGYNVIVPSSAGTGVNRTNTMPNNNGVIALSVNGNFADAAGNITVALSGSGTVTSVNASISGALAVSGGPITSTGTLAFAWQGSTAQYVRGDGSLATLPAAAVNFIADNAGTNQFSFTNGDAIRFGAGSNTSLTFDAATKRVIIASVDTNFYPTSLNFSSGTLTLNGVGISTLSTTIALSQLLQVSISSPVSGQLFQYNGTNWVNWTPNYLTSVNHSHNVGDAAGNVKFSFQPNETIEFDGTGMIGVAFDTANKKVTFNATETDAIALAKNITLNAGTGVSITGLATQSLNSGPTWTVAVNTTFTDGRYVPLTRSVNTQYSITGGGDLSADRTLNLVNDVAAPGNTMYYGTSSIGVRGWFSMISYVTSVAASVTASTALTVSGTPITTSGTLAFSWTGTTAQYVKGNGTLGTTSGDFILNQNASVQTANWRISGNGTAGGVLTAGTGVTINANGVLSYGSGFDTPIGPVKFVLGGGNDAYWAGVYGVFPSSSGSAAVQDVALNVSNGGSYEAMRLTGVGGVLILPYGTQSLRNTVNIINGYFDAAYVGLTQGQSNVAGVYVFGYSHANGSSIYMNTYGATRFFINSAGTLNASSLAGTGTRMVVADSAGNLSTQAIPSSGSGTVTSVNASISGALAVSGGPVTTAGTLAFTWQGTSSQYVRGDGTLSTLPSTPSLQQVTDVGFITTHSLVVNTSPAGGASWFVLNWSSTMIAQLARTNGSTTEGGGIISLKDANSTNALNISPTTLTGNRNQNFPNANGTLAVTLNGTTAADSAGNLALPVQMSISVNGSGLKFVNDLTTPGGSMYYGTNAGGTKGWNALPTPGAADLPWVEHYLPSDVVLTSSYQDVLTFVAPSNGYYLIIFTASSLVTAFTPQEADIAIRYFGSVVSSSAGTSSTSHGYSHASVVTSAILALVNGDTVYGSAMDPNNSGYVNLSASNPDTRSTGMRIIKIAPYSP